MNSTVVAQLLNDHLVLTAASLKYPHPAWESWTACRYLQCRDFLAQLSLEKIVDAIAEFPATGIYDDDWAWLPGLREGYRVLANFYRQEHCDGTHVKEIHLAEGIILNPCLLTNKIWPLVSAVWRNDEFLQFWFPSASLLFGSVQASLSKASLSRRMLKTRI